MARLELWSCVLVVICSGDVLLCFCLSHLTSVTGLLCKGGEHEYRLTKYLLSNYELVSYLLFSPKMKIFLAVCETCGELQQSPHGGLLRVLASDCRPRREEPDPHHELLAHSGRCKSFLRKIQYSIAFKISKLELKWFDSFK